MVTIARVDRVPEGITGTTKTLHKQGAFDMDDKAVFRSIAVITVLFFIIAIWCVLKLYRRRRKRNRVRRYDILSSKQLAPSLVRESDHSDDELFNSPNRQSLQ